MEDTVNTGFSGEEASWVLGLPSQPRVCTSRSRQPKITQHRGSARVAGSHSATNFVEVIVINAGEDVGENIQSYFRDRERFPAQFRDRSCLGVILSADGAISSPTIDILGSALVYEGLHEMVVLSGLYCMSKNGQVKMSGGLKMTFCDPDGQVFGGPVIGSLIAATTLQVSLLTFIHDS